MLPVGGGHLKGYALAGQEFGELPFRLVAPR